MTGFCDAFMLLNLYLLHVDVSVQTDSDFNAKPMVMLLGQYSTGKTTFIKHLLKCNYPGMSIYVSKFCFF